MARRLFQLGYLLSYILFPLLVMALASQRLANIPLRLLVFFILVLAGAWLFRKAWSSRGWGTALLITSLGYTFAYKLASFIPDVSTYPFSLGWSEASRYYYASLWFSRQEYGIAAPPSILHPSRYLMQSLPFLLPGASLVIHRLWQVLLWVLTAALTSWLLVRRLRLRGKKGPLVITLGTTVWAFLFLFQGPVYYHLLVMVILLLWGFDSNRFWRNLVLVILASLWAGISRVNWLPVPGLLAASLYLLEVRVAGKPLWRYLLPAFVWVVVGTGMAYASQQAYQLASGNPLAWFGSSFTSDLLWYRLLPNPTYPLGILPSAVMVSLPVVGLMVLKLQHHWRDYHWTRLLGLGAVLFVLFLGGVLVSVKIGGGSNLHNLDAYLSLLLVISSYIYFNRFIADYPPPAVETSLGEEAPIPVWTHKTIESILLVAAVALPLYFPLSAGAGLPHRDFASAQGNLGTIDTAAHQVAKQGGEVLFINQRHLLTFDDVQDVPLVPDYELVFLMEMAMANNTAYLSEFHEDISHQRFSLIVSEPLTTQHQGRTHSFGEENDAWVERISEPILCYYEPSAELNAVGVVLYIPRSVPCR